MGQQNECDIFNSLTRDGPAIPKKVILEFSSNDDSSDSDGKRRKRVWRKSESSSKLKSHRKLTQKFKPYSRKSIVSSANHKNFNSEYDNSRNFSRGLPGTTIELKNVPSEVNNILQLYQYFSQFGEITLIQIKRNNDSRALLSFKTIIEATRALEKASSVIPNINASWFVDYCLLKRFPKKSAVKSKEFNEKEKSESILLEAALKSDNIDPFCDIADDSSELYKKRSDVVNSISKLIKMKNKLLFDQLKSRNEIANKLAKCESGSEHEKMLLILLKKVQEQIDESQRSIEHSLKQKTIFSNCSFYASSSSQDLTEHISGSSTESSKNLQQDESESDFIPISLLSYEISLDKCENVGPDSEIRGEENYFSSRSYGHAINVCSPKKP